MPIKLIFSLILIVIAASFTGFNLNNRCDLWIFYTFKDVPVFATVIASFVCGVLVTLPFTFGKKAKKNVDKSVRDKKKSSGKKNKEDQQADLNADAEVPVVDFDNV